MTAPPFEEVAERRRPRSEAPRPFELALTTPGSTWPRITTAGSTWPRITTAWLILTA